MLLGVAVTVIVLGFFAVDTLRNAPETFTAIVAATLLGRRAGLVWKRVRDRPGRSAEEGAASSRRRRHSSNGTHPDGRESRLVTMRFAKTMCADLPSASSPVRSSGPTLALAFDESVASSAEVHVEGANFYPPMLEDIRSATSSVHINQFGFRPGVIGDAFAEALVSKAAEGVPVRLVVDKQGLGSRGLLARVLRPSYRGRRPGLRRPRDEAARAGRAARKRWRDALESGGARPHRPSQGRRRRRRASAGSAAPESRTTSRTGASTTCSSGSRGPWSRSCSSSSSPASAGSAARWPADELDAALPRAGTGRRSRFRPSSCTTLRAGTGRSRPRSRASSRARRRRSTS